MTDYAPGTQRVSGRTGGSSGSSQEHLIGGRVVQDLLITEHRVGGGQPHSFWCGGGRGGRSLMRSGISHALRALTQGDSILTARSGALIHDHDFAELLYRASPLCTASLDRHARMNLTPFAMTSVDDDRHVADSSKLVFEMTEIPSDHEVSDRVAASPGECHEDFLDVLPPVGTRAILFHDFEDLGLSGREGRAGAPTMGLHAYDRWRRSPMKDFSMRDGLQSAQTSCFEPAGLPSAAAPISQCPPPGREGLKG